MYAQVLDLWSPIYYAWSVIVVNCHCEQNKALGASLGLFSFPMPEITIVLKNRMFSQVVLMALLAAGFESISREYLHDGVHLHLKVPAGSQNGV